MSIYLIEIVEIIWTFLTGFDYVTEIFQKNIEIVASDNSRLIKKVDKARLPESIYCAKWNPYQEPNNA